MNGFGRRLKDARGNESQSSFAKRLGISQVCYSRYESDLREPDLDTLYQIGILTGVSADWLLGLPERGGSSTTVTGNVGAVAVSAGARASVGRGLRSAPPPSDCANCKYKRLADAFKAL